MAYTRQERPQSSSRAFGSNEAPTAVGLIPAPDGSLRLSPLWSTRFVIKPEAGRRRDLAASGASRLGRCPLKPDVELYEWRQQLV